MKGWRVADWMAPAIVAVGLSVLVWIFWREVHDYSRSVTEWARRDLEVRTEQAAASLAEPLATSDFRRIHAFGDACEKDGVRVTIFSANGGIVFDSLRRGEPSPDSLYATRPCGAGTVRLGLPYARVLAPVNRARRGLVLSGAVGGLAVLLVFFLTYRQRLRVRALMQLERFRRDFISDVSHEIKTPLTGILGATDLLEEEVARGAMPEDALAKRLTGMIRRESTRLNGLVQSILDLARLERPDLPLERTAVDLYGLVAEAVVEFEPQAARQGVRLTLAPRPAGPVVVTADARLVQQAVGNLVANALRHSGSPDVHLEVSSGDRRAEVRVEDRGRGVPSAHRARIFERFHRVDDARAAESGGAGLGLAIVRTIARCHGGEARYEPVQPHGSRFVLVLPRGD